MINSKDTPTVAALLTAPGRGAIATIWLRGPAAIAAVDQFFRARSGRTIAVTPFNRIVYGHWQHAQGDEDVIVVRTDKQTVEIHSHGGAYAAQWILGALRNAGICETNARTALGLQSENPWQAAALEAASQAFTLAAADRLLANADGRLVRAIAELSALIDDKACHTATIDRLNALAKTYAYGLRLVQGWQIVIAGRPNVGKSSLINRLLGYQRAIVFDQPGTTRDVVTERTAVAGWPVRICDTAGLRESDEAIEQLGVSRARQAIQAADLTIWVSDLSQPWTAEEQADMEQIPHVLHLANKSDLCVSSDNRPNALRVSLLHDQDIQSILSAITGLFSSILPLCEPFLVTAWQLQAIRQVIERISAGDFQTAKKWLNQPTYT